jgi:hypothetical protein
MLYLLDANVLITAKDAYYPLDRVPQFWEWLEHMGRTGHVKIPLEIFEEIKEGPKEKDLLYEWIQKSNVRQALVLDEDVNGSLVTKVIDEGYASDLKDDEVTGMGRDPFLIAYALVAPAQRCVVTAEVSKPSLKRQKRKVPDVCKTLNVKWCGPFEFNRALDFRTDWSAAS